jgi:hypothetical protein
MTNLNTQDAFPDVDDNARAVFTVTFICRGTRADIRTALFESNVFIPAVFAEHRVDIDEVMIAQVEP